MQGGYSFFDRNTKIAVIENQIASQ